MSHWPQVYFAYLIAVGICVNLYKDGKETSVSGAILTLIIFPFNAYALYVAGFWSVWGFAP